MRAPCAYLLGLRILPALTPEVNADGDEADRQY